MTGTREIAQFGGADDGGLGLREAATLLEQTGRQARRELEPYPPWLFVVRAAIVLAVGGAAWLSVRGQHPYQGPTVSAILVIAPLLVVNLVATLAVARRRTTGVSGRSRLRPVEITVMVVIWVGVYVVLGVLAGAGVSPAIVYGWYLVGVPLIVAGIAWAAIMAARANWRECGTAVAVAVVGAAAVFAGPVGAWAVAGVGLCITLLGSAAAIACRQRA
ncbi:MAG: hypothetical protein ABI473_14460 [Candidatus Dormibacter sp.]